MSRATVPIRVKARPVVKQVSELQFVVVDTGDELLIRVRDKLYKVADLVEVTP